MQRTFLRLAAPVLAALAAGCVQAGGTGTPDQPAGQDIIAVRRGAISGTKQRIEMYFAINPDCTPQGYPQARITSQPKNGQITFEQGDGYPNFTKDNIRNSCNSTKVTGTVAYFTPNADFAGSDSGFVEVIFPAGSTRIYQYTFDVLK
jgi:hypothetical protein